MFRPRYADAITHIYFSVDKVGRTRRGCTRRHKLSPCAALIASPLQASPMRTSSTSGDSSIRVPSQTTFPPPSSPPKKNVRLRFSFFVSFFPLRFSSPLTPLPRHPTPLVDEEHARALEEQWIDGLGGGGGATGGSAESDSRARAVLNGIIIGFFFPLLPFFFLRAPKPAAFWESGHALETPESTVFSYALLPS